MILELILDFDYVGLTCIYVDSLENYASRFVILVCNIRRLEKPFDQDLCFCILFMSACEALLFMSAGEALLLICKM